MADQPDEQLDPGVAGRQKQFLDVISRDEATARFEAAIDLTVVGVETVPLLDALNRVLANDVRSTVDVTSFDRSNVDGFAVRSADTISATEDTPVRLTVNAEVIVPGQLPSKTVETQTATSIATGAMLPRGADAVVMIEDTDLVETANGIFVDVNRSVAPGQSISYAGTDISTGEVVLRTMQLLTSREIGVLAAIGMSHVEVVRKPTVAIISTGNEIVPPGQPARAASVFDSNAAILSAAVQEAGCQPVPLGTGNDDLAQLRSLVNQAMDCDAIVMSGGTSKGAGDLSYKVVSEFDNPGIVAHGVALKPGKPVCLAATNGKPVVVLPGFPTSAIFTFHEFVAPVLRRLAGQAQRALPDVSATLPMRVNSDKGRHEYLLVSLVADSGDGLVAYPMGKGSGSVTTFSQADGFMSIPQRTEIVEAGSSIKVRLLSERLRPADLVVIGSHCPGLEFLLSELSRQGITSKTISIGSTAGLAAAKRCECDIAGIHLLDPTTNTYNRPFLDDSVQLVEGYARRQGLVFRKDDSRFAEQTTPADFIRTAIDAADCVMVNRNSGSGTRILIDRHLKQQKPKGYAVQPGSHTAVVAAIAQERADWGMAVEHVAKTNESMGFLPVQQERYDFVIPVQRFDRSAVQGFVKLLQDPSTQMKLSQFVGVTIEAAGSS